jgi:hypothetical protein
MSFVFFAGNFSWDDYLKDNNAKPAPQECFKQVNWFCMLFLDWVFVSGY